MTNGEQKQRRTIQNLDPKQPAAAEAKFPVLNSYADLEKMAQEWLAYLDVSANSELVYRKSLGYFFQWMIDHNLSDPARADILAYRNDLIQENLSVGTVNQYVRAVKSFYQWLEHIGAHPDITKGLKHLKSDYGFKKGYLSGEQCRKVLDVFNEKDPNEKNLRNKAILGLLMTTGLRTIEVCNADVGDFEMRGEMRILRVKGKGHHEKGDFVKVPDQTWILIRDYLNTRDALKAGSPLFASLDHRFPGRRLTTKSIREICKDAFAAAGIDAPNISAHSLRHTTATLALKEGAKIEQVQQALRHASMDTTMIYVHAIERERNAAEDLVANLVFDSAKEED